MILTKVRLFASSYSLLLALLALRFENWQLRWCLAITAGLIILDTLWIAIVLPRRVNAEPHTVASVVDRGGEVAGYLATYLLPFLVTPRPTGTDLAAYGLFLFVTGVVVIRSDLSHINPTLYLLGYRVVSVTSAEGFDGYAIVRSRIHAGDV